MLYQLFILLFLSCLCSLQKPMAASMDVADVKPSMDLILLTAYGPSNAHLHIWWQETELFSLADYLPTKAKFRPVMELLRRATFLGTPTFDAVRKWFFETFQQYPVAETCSAEQQDWVLRFEFDAELHNCQHVIRSWTMDPVIRGKLRISISMDSSETDMDVTFISQGLMNSPLPWPMETENRYGVLPFARGLQSNTQLAVEDFQGLVLRLLSTECGDNLCAVM